MAQFYRVGLWLGIAALILLPLAWILGFDGALSPLAVTAAVGIALGLGAISVLKTYQYTAWIVAAIVCGMLYPGAFLQWGDFDLRNKWVILVIVQLVMFGMGTQMNIQDFTGLRTMGKAVVTGLLCQFSIMPVIGFLLTRVFEFEPEIAAGVILIGSCSSGLASNVMVFLARANLSLSITLTAVATLVAPLMTPFLMKMLAGTYVEIDFLDMCFQIVKIVIVPIGAALLYDGMKNDLGNIRKVVNALTVMAIAVLLAMVLGLYNYLEATLGILTLEIVVLINFLLGAVVFGNLFYRLYRWKPGILKFMPFVSMFGIVYFTTVTTAASRDNLLAIGLFLLLASILHNSLGYVLGYWLSRLFGLDKDSCRTVALEVGMQNGGMASGLAGVMGKLATLGLAAAVFSPWMNISGSVLANYWRKKNMDPEKVGSDV